MKFSHFLILTLLSLTLLSSKCGTSTAQENGTSLGKGLVYYSTWNSVRHISTSNETNTIYFEESSNNYGLNEQGDKLYIATHKYGPGKIKPKYKEYQYNDLEYVANVFTPSDFYSSSNGMYVAGNYKVYKFTDIDDSFNTATEINQQLNFPFSFASKDNFLFVAGIDRLVAINTQNNKSYEIEGFNNHVAMAGYMVFDDNDNLYVTDVNLDRITKFDADNFNTIINQINSSPNNYTIPNPWSGVYYYSDPILQSSEAYKGPIGIDFKNDKLLIGVNKGSGDGRLVTMDINSGVFSEILNDLEDPRAIKVVK